jgi:hypothetical protein
MVRTRNYVANDDQKNREMSAPAIYRIVDISYRNPTLVASAFVGSRYRW